MKHELSRLVFVLVLSMVAGLLTGQYFFCLFAGTLIYMVWRLRSLNKLVTRMRRGKRLDLTSTSGLEEDIIYQYESLRHRLKKRKKKLSRYLQRFKETIQTLPDGVIVLSENDEIEGVNLKAEQYLGINHTHDIGLKLVNLIRNPELVRFLKEDLRSEVKPGLRLEMVSPSNRNVYLELRLAPFSGSGKLLVVRDITKLNRINKMRDDFIANASHELRTPLTVISGYLETIEDEITEASPEEKNFRVKQMREQTDKMRLLIDDLLKLSALETTDAIVESRPVRVSDLVNKGIEAAKVIGGDKPRNFIVDLDNKLFIEGSESQIYSAISNVINNAVQHTPEDGEISVKWYAKNGEAVLEVTDTGEGIDAEHIPRITERFYRVDKGRSREKGGTGLGLAIVKHVLSNHGSRLDIESTPGKGTMFRFRFPRPANTVKDSS